MPDVDLTEMEKDIIKGATVVNVPGNSGQLSRATAMLMDRNKTHGDFALNAKVSQAIKEAISWGDVKGMSAVHREATDMIALKLSRIASGKADFKDHWEDIIGYCHLALKACK
jgi:hypothetical protein